MTDTTPSTDLLSQATRQRLQEVRRGLLHLHKALLEVERRSYERLHGRVGSGNEMLQLVIQHPWFAWLRSISELVVQIDETLDAGAEEPASERDAQALLQQVRSLLKPSESSEDFGRRYYRTLQEDPDSVLAHAAVSRLLPPEA